MDKPFEVGEWVFSWPDAMWGRVRTVDRVPLIPNASVTLEFQVSDVAGYARAFSYSEIDGGKLTRDPIIPPKPKKMVTKEAKCVDQYYSHPTGMRLVYVVPTHATNVKPPTFEVEE